MENSIINSQEITSSYLRDIVGKVEVNIDYILNRCLADAKSGEEKHNHYDSLNKKQKEELLNRGFTIEDLTDPRDGYHFIISW